MMAFNLFLKDKAVACLLLKYQNQEFRNTSSFLCHQVNNFLQDELHEAKPSTKI